MFKQQGEAANLCRTRYVTLTLTRIRNSYMQNISGTSRKFAVITGASTGIGLELAKQFATHDYDLFIVSHSNKIEAAATELRQSGAQVECLTVDLATPEGVEECYQKISAIGRPVDALALNAGVGTHGDFSRETDLQREMEIINLNVGAVVHLSKRVLKDMVARGEGKVLFTSSVVSETPSPLMAVYAASKAFVQSFALALRNELKDTNITITSLMPGATETAFFAKANMLDTRVGKMKKDDPADVARQGFEALMNGDDKVVAASFMSKAQSVVQAVLPDGVKASANRKMNESAA